MKLILSLSIAIFLAATAEADDSICSDLPSNHEILFSSPVACTNYYKCYNGVFSEEVCPDGKYFSKTVSACVDPAEAKCIGRRDVSDEDESTSELTSESTTEIIETTPATTEPPTFFTSAATESTTTTTTEPPPSTPTTEPPTESTSTSPTESPSTSTPEPSSTPETSTPLGPTCEEDTTSYWPHPENCNWFIECYNGDFYEMACPPNLYFSAEKIKCVSAANSECCSKNPSQCGNVNE